MNLGTQLEIDPSLLDLWTQLDSDVQAATALVYLCHAGADGTFRKKYALTWWGEFLPLRVSLAARTSSTLSEFTATLSARLQGTIGDRYHGEAHRAIWQELIILSRDRQRKILDVLENQASVCVTLIRADLDVKKKKPTNTSPQGANHGAETGGKDRDNSDPGQSRESEQPDLFSGATATPESESAAAGPAL